MARRRDRVAPLAILLAGGVLGACVCTLTVGAVVLNSNGPMAVPVWQLIAAGGPMALLISVGAAAIAARFARMLRLLRADALHRLHEPSAPVCGSADSSSFPIP